MLSFYTSHTEIFWLWALSQYFRLSQEDFAIQALVWFSFFSYFAEDLDANELGSAIADSDSSDVAPKQR